MNNFNKIFETLAQRNDRSVIWNNWLDYCIDLNLMNVDKQEHNFKGNEEEYSELLCEWLLQLSKDLEKKPVSDMLGEFYEELVTSQSKSKNMGQFYTPTDVTILMNKLAIGDDVPVNGMVNDCACGSARMLLNAHVQCKGNVICIGQDLDETSCKMAVLNFWSHGVTGSILHMNTLTGEFYGAWRVNNYLHYGLSIPHIELVNEKEAYHFIGTPNNREESVVELKPVKSTGSVQSTLM